MSHFIFRNENWRKYLNFKQITTSSLWIPWGSNSGALRHLRYNWTSCETNTRGQWRISPVNIMADVFELELHDLPEDDPSRAPDSDDDIIDIDEVIMQNSRRIYWVWALVCIWYFWWLFISVLRTKTYWLDKNQYVERMT